ncbi:MAG: hypothetical protein LH472_07900, partial [Pyrinomonadaceae bacterium]|nr:hypothetical protein [Pyrinomonadaceae bacterium]
MPIINDQKLKAYFLGTLAAEETARLEEECANDAKLTEQANIVESELADDFLRGNLTAPECRSFEENYLITEARREKLQFAQNLWKVTNENQTADLPAPSSIWQTLFGNPRRLAFGGLLA